MPTVHLSSLNMGYSCTDGSALLFPANYRWFTVLLLSYCYCYYWFLHLLLKNRWLLYKSVDPGLVLRWLVSELQQAESRGEVVHIIGHIPPFYADCFAQWAHQFSRIVSRWGKGGGRPWILFLFYFILSFIINCKKKNRYNESTLVTLMCLIEYLYRKHTLRYRHRGTHAHSTHTGDCCTTHKHKHTQVPWV